jgi:flagellar protein FlaG
MIEDVVTREALPAPHSVGPATPHGPQPSHADPTSQPVNRETLESTVARVQQSVEQFNSSLKIEIDPDSKQVIVKILNDQSGEVIRQIPAEEMVEIARRLDASQALLITKRT